MNTEKSDDTKYESVITQRNPQLLILYAFFTLSIGTVLFITRNYISLIFAAPYEESALRVSGLITITAALLIISGLAFVLSYYLRYGFSLISIKTDDYPTQKFVASEIEIDSIKKSLANLKDQISSIKELNIDFHDITLTDKLNELSEILKNKLKSEQAEDLINEMENRFKQEYELENQITILSDQYYQTASRLKSEIEQLGRRGNLNLIIGISTAMMGLFILGYMIFTRMLPFSFENNNVQWWMPFAHSFPRITLVFLIELFAYFFLRLYKASLDEIKYYQNELTNVEMKYLGFRQSLELNDLDSTREAINSFLNVERNFILSKKETTVEIEKAKLDNNYMKEMIASLTGMASTFGKKDNKS